MTYLANRLKQMQPSPTLALNTKVNALKSKGVDIINLTAGEPDFDTPDWIKQAAYESMQQGLTKYTAVDGILSLKRAICDKLKRDNNLEYDFDNIVVGSGAKHVIFNALMATINKGDEVIIPAPYWVSYPEMVQLFGGIPEIIGCGEEQGFKITAENLEKAITSKTKWLILNSPSNPTGAVYTSLELKNIAAVLKKNPHVLVLSDDIYEYLVYDDAQFCTLASICPDLKPRILVVNGVSKAYAMTGWRIGYGAGPKDLIKAIAMVQSQSTSNATSISQGAAVAALNGPHGFLNDWRKTYKERRDKTMDKINKISGLHCQKADGAFYLYVNCAAIIGSKTPKGDLLNTDEDICIYLLENGVAVVHGGAFGLSPYFRISYATKMENLMKACERIEKAIGALHHAA